MCNRRRGLNVSRAVIRVIIEYPRSLRSPRAIVLHSWCLRRRIGRERSSCVVHVCAGHSSSIQDLETGKSAPYDGSIAYGELSRHAADRRPLPAALLFDPRALPDPAAMHASLVPAITACFPSFSSVVLERLYLLRASAWKSVRLRLPRRWHVHDKCIVFEMYRPIRMRNDLRSASTSIARPGRRNSRLRVFKRPSVLACMPLLQATSTDLTSLVRAGQCRARSLRADFESFGGRLRCTWCAGETWGDKSGSRVGSACGKIVIGVFHAHLARHWCGELIYWRTRLLGCWSGAVFLQKRFPNDRLQFELSRRL